MPDERLANKDPIGRNSNQNKSFEYSKEQRSNLAEGKSNKYSETLTEPEGIWKEYRFNLN